MNTNFNLKEFEDPVEHFIEKPIIMSLDPSNVQIAEIFVRPGDTQLYDNYFAYWLKVSIKFFEIA